MAAAADEAGIHFRILNGSKGPAVRATRAQADRALYKAAIRRRLENQPNLWLFQAACDDLVVQGDRVCGVITQVGVRFDATCVVLTAGTFLDGRIHIGLDSHAGGRSGEAPAKMLSARLKELKLPQGRLKTGTPPRLDGRTIDYSKLVEQPGDGVDPGCDIDDLPVFSFLGDPRAAPAPGLVLDHPDQRADPRDRSVRLRPKPDVHRAHRRRRAALLPEHRGQGEPLRGQGFAPDLPRARGADDARGLSERHFDVAALFRADRRGSFDRRSRIGAHRSARLRHRVRLLRPPGVASRASRRGRSRACFSPVRSTARPATRKRPPKGCMLASTPRYGLAATRLGSRRATRRTSACSSTTWSRKG